CRKALAIWRTPWFLAASGTMGIVSRRVVVTTDASTKGWGAVCEGRSVNGVWSVTEVASHINVLELRTVVLALQHFLPRLSGQHVLVRTDNPVALAYINRQGGVHSQSLHHWGDSPAPMGSEARPFPKGSSYTRSPQLRCGPVIEGRSSSSRLVSTPTGDRGSASC